MYDALILVNGEIPHPTIWHSLPYRRLICTDGAANVLQETPTTPDVIIGDMDSIADLPQLQFPHAQILSIENDQATTDFEKALLFCQQNAFTRVICLGIFGKSPDHSLYNLSLLARFNASFELLAFAGTPPHCQWIFPLRAHTHIHSAPHETLSLLAFSNSVITTHGLKWELKQSTLSLLEHNSVRNQTMRANTHIECQGDCLAFLSAINKPTIVYEKPLKGL